MFIDKRNCTYQEILKYESQLIEQGYVENTNFFNISELWNEIQHCCKLKIFKRFFEFNGKYILLDNEDISEDDVYLFVLGKTKKEKEAYDQEQILKYDRELNDYKQKIPQLKIDFYNRGKTIIEEKYLPHWKEVIEVSLNSCYRDYLLESVLEIIEMSNQNKDFETIKNKFYEQGHSGCSYHATLLLFKELSDKGKEYFNWNENQ